MLALGVTACQTDVTQPDMLYSASCTPPASLMAEARPQPFAFGDLHAAFQHVAGPMASALGSSEKVDFLSETMSRLAAANATVANDAACRLLYVASDALAAVPETAENLPDRDGIRTVLVMAAGVLKAGAK